MVNSVALNCSQCNKKASYRDKLGKLYCYDCYWGQSGHNKPKGDTFTDSDIYRNCSYCGSGDICSIGWCIAKCRGCGIVDKGKGKEYKGSTYCSGDCVGIAQEKEKGKKAEQERLNEERTEQNKEKAKANFEKLSTECFQETFQLGIKKQSQGLARSDYKKITNLEKRLASAAKNPKLDDPLIQEEIINLQNLFQELKNKNDDSGGLNNSNPSNNDNNNPNRESRKNDQQGSSCPKEQREQIQQDINNLTNKPNRTPAEEQSLKDKKAELERLNKPVNNEQDKGKNNWLKPTLIISGVILVSGVVIYLIVRNKKQSDR